MYPLNMQLPAPQVGFAVANDQAEHAALTAHGYLPPLEAHHEVKHDKADIMAALDAAGVKYDKRLSAEKLAALLP